MQKLEFTHQSNNLKSYTVPKAGVHTQKSELIIAFERQTAKVVDFPTFFTVLRQ